MWAEWNGTTEPARLKQTGPSDGEKADSTGQAAQGTPEGFSFSYCIIFFIK